MMNIFQSDVQILDSETFAILFVSSSPMRVSATEEYKPTKFTVESGEERSDHIVKSANEVSIDFVLTGAGARDQFELLRQAARDHTLVTIQTRLSNYSSMLVESLGLDESSDMHEGAAVPVRFSEWSEIEPEYGELKASQVAEPKQSSTVKRGRQSGNEATVEQTANRKTSILGRWGVI